MITRAFLIATCASAAALLGGCANMPSFGAPQAVTTSSLPEPPKVDPACNGLSAQIANLKADGITDKVAKAAMKKYKLTPADLTKADQLNQVSADFQARCGKVPMQAAMMPVAPATPAADQAAVKVMKSAQAAVKPVQTAAGQAVDAAAATPAAVAAVAAPKAP